MEHESAKDKKDTKENLSRSYALRSPSGVQNRSYKMGIFAKM